jgi:hypothetical protein
MRSINVSTDVYAAIWAARKFGEESEDVILARLLGCASSRQTAKASRAGKEVDGFCDTRNGVRFPEGFETFRSYFGKRFTAVASDGVWIRKDTGVRYPSLNQLNASIVAGAENVWNGNWQYRDADGVAHSIDRLRRRP